MSADNSEIRDSSTFTPQIAVAPNTQEYYDRITKTETEDNLKKRRIMPMRASFYILASQAIQPPYDCRLLHDASLYIKEIGNEAVSSGLAMLYNHTTGKGKLTFYKKSS